MKVILSSRLTMNGAQLAALREALEGKSLRGVEVLFVVDAASDAMGNVPEWVRGDVKKFEALGAKVTMCSLVKDDWVGGAERKIFDADILFFEGGSTLKLLGAIQGTELMKKVVDERLDGKVWFGISAGGCVLSPKCYSSCEKWFMETPGEEPAQGLTREGSPYFIPHFESRNFGQNVEENLRFVREKLSSACAILGREECVVTGVLEGNEFVVEREMYEAKIITG